MKNINNYRKKFYSLLESEIGDVKPLLSESHGIILSEESIWGEIAKKALSWVGKNEDDIAKIFKTSEVVLAKSMDDIVSVALKSKNIAALDDIQAKLMHFYNPSGQAANVANAQKQMVNFLNGFSKSRGKIKWSEFRNEVQGIKPNVTQGTSQSSASQAASHAVHDMMQGQRVSNRWYGWKPENIDFTKFTNKMSFDDLNKSIASAIKNNNWNLVPRSGFEKLGIPNFREYLQKNISKINEVDPLTGRWSVIFK